ncbi:MAG: hypothetical protein K9I85_09310 [Saprospiraceae bacterium]|nr:hypothetical protein [Saprospiraceae bacterium]
MKKMFLITLMMLIVATTFASTPGLDCREAYTKNPELAEKARVYTDLVESNWQINWQNGQGKAGQIIFHDFGAADQILANGDGTFVYHQSQWTLEEYNNALFLVISHLNGDNQTNMYRVFQTCDGIDLTDIGSLERLSFKFVGKKGNASVDHMSQNLTGEWISSGYAFDQATTMDDCGTFQPMHDAFLQYSFRGDGTFARALGNKGMTLREIGFWDITDDGQFLLMHVKDASGNQILRTDVAELIHMQDGSFTLRQALVNKDKNDLFCTQVKEFGFTRWTPRP